ncbi:Beta-galactosidase BoGH2A [Madurella mycetomatis]|uniref:Beta-galactosidase BoGH2A n=1 Tax=Madurella mycetomatis TaxID=100816 RepID=A0A175VUQ5_9PEZI|nr:Beta-galactosidase BoGH2A [Madurella mycetomatis]
MEKSIYLEVDGAMSYAMVWLNGHLVGGWPYGYSSFRLELTPYLEPGDANQLAIRLDNPVQSSRWYPGGGIYRSVWLTKVNHTHVGQWGTVISSRNVSTQIADLDIMVRIENSGTLLREVEVATETQFGIRSFVFDAEKGLLVNGEKVRIQGVNEHHDLEALGSSFNVRAAERKLEVLGEMGCNAIRMSHNPPAPEFLDLTDRMGFLVMDEALDSWERQKTANDYHLIFGDWHEADIRSMMRRDRNHVSIFAWSAGNEVGEQTSGSAGSAMALRLCQIIHSEDPGRPCTASMNAARPDMPFPRSLDLISLNYQGEGIRDTPPYAGLEGIKTHPLYPDFHRAFPDKMILSSETAAALSTRDTYFFPVTDELSAPANNQVGGGGHDAARQVSAYELYTTPFGASPDKVFLIQDRHPFVAGEFVWSGWDYLGEPTPYHSARSSYFGIVDLAGFKKDRFYLYQARWCPGLRMAHILPHWTWSDRVGQVTPVHVFSAADEAELFLNGESQGRKRIGTSSYRFR